MGGGYFPIGLVSLKQNGVSPLYELFRRSLNRGIDSYCCEFGTKLLQLDNDKKMFLTQQFGDMHNEWMIERHASWALNAIQIPFRKMFR